MARGLAAFFSLACWLAGIQVVNAQTDITTSPVQDIPIWAIDASLALTLTTSGDASPLQYTVIPLTPAVGLNDSRTALRTINIVGNLIAADPANYKVIKDSRDVAYMSCDENDSQMSPSELLLELMQVKPTPIKAILLYSTTYNWCKIDYDYNNLVYGSIFTMADPAEAATALSFLNDTDNGEIVKANIYGNVTEGPSGASSGGENSVAMIVLYSITGLITLLILYIITTGAVRAHRHPERYGPRPGQDGRVRQSRARGVARAVLDTIPIVRFGHPSDPKPDPEVELDVVTNDERSNAMPNRPDSHERSESEMSRPSEQDASHAVPQRTTDTPTTDAHRNSAETPGCTICTEDFTSGEYVRVLPCNHQFHPACIDPWLINVAGTCPLCRYNLDPRTQTDHTQPSLAETVTNPPATDSTRDETQGRDQESGEPLAPPLGDDAEGSSIINRSGISRYFDLKRLRNAPVEERMAALRQFRAEQAARSSQNVDGDELHSRARFNEWLRDKFRVRTRAQLLQRGAQS